MTDQTAIDIAFDVMQNAPDPAQAQPQYLARISDSLLYILLTKEIDDGQMEPELFDVDGTAIVLAFDTSERLVEFTQTPSPYVEMSGRALVQMLEGEGLGLGINLGAASENLLAPEAVDWMAVTLDERPQDVEERIEEITAPKNMPENLLLSLGAKLAMAGRLADCAYMMSATYASGRVGTLMAFIGAEDWAREPLAQAVQEVLSFSGYETGEVDVSFFLADDPVVANFEAHGLKLEMPEPQPQEIDIQELGGPKAPGMDPDAPPKLR
ncbi:MAG: SseB family protein [Halocynthiibacter sp.]